MKLHDGLSRIIHPLRPVTSHLHRIACASDASYFRLIPLAVFQPESIGEIRTLFQFTGQNQIPMTFRAAEKEAAEVNSRDYVDITPPISPVKSVCPKRRERITLQSCIW
jgi:hypothetical protein